MCQPEGSHDGHDVRVVREVKVDVLSQRKCRAHFIEGRVDVGTTGREVVQVTLKPGVYFFDETDADSSAGGGGEAVVTVELQIYAVFETFPFFIGEKVAPFGVSVLWQALAGPQLKERTTYCDRLVRTNCLGVIGVSRSPVVSSCHRLEACCRVGKVDAFPNQRGIVATSGVVVFRVVALVVARQGVVKAELFPDDDERCVVCPFEAEEACHEVLSGLEHAILACGACQNLFSGFI